MNIIDSKPQLLKVKSKTYKDLYNPSIKKYIMGRNEYAKQVLKSFQKDKITLTGIIDDYTNDISYENYPIYKCENLESANCLVIVCILDGKLISAINKIESYGVDKILSFFDLVLIDENSFNQVPFFKNNITDIQNNTEKYFWLYNQLADNISRNTLQNIVDFRFNFDYEIMRGFTYRLEEQYFDVITFNDEEVFLDCGGYDGETTKKFIQLNPTYKSVHVFEPSPKQFELIKRGMANYSNVNFYPFATNDKNTVLSFEANRGSASGLSENGDIRVKAVRLDDVVHEKVTFIKLDVEGAEFQSLIGAERLIKTYKPKLAVCVYHNQSDFWRIPELILSYNPNYEIFLRHYTEGYLETVMYFL